MSKVIDLTRYRLMKTHGNEDAHNELRNNMNMQRIKRLHIIIDDQNRSVDNKNRSYDMSKKLNNLREALDRCEKLIENLKRGEFDELRNREDDR